MAKCTSSALGKCLQSQLICTTLWDHRKPVQKAWLRDDLGDCNVCVGNKDLVWKGMTSGHVGFFLWQSSLHNTTGDPSWRCFYVSIGIVGLKLGNIPGAPQCITWQSAIHCGNIKSKSTLNVIHTTTERIWFVFILAVHCTTSINTILHFSSISAQYNRSRACLSGSTPLTAALASISLLTRWFSESCGQR